ncbi:hypothetical protein B7494_g226 [Chlorociboria aeruginascens]|nr:hypothetical protein B7494_g226 [Chlorociboria aeruginascens]
MAEHVSHGGGDNGGESEAKDLTLVYAAMMEELGVKRKDDLPLEDNARVPGIPFAKPPNPRPQSSRVQDPEISEKIAGWKSLHLEDNDPTNAQIDSIADGNLGRMRRKAAEEERAKSNRSVRGGSPSRISPHMLTSSRSSKNSRGRQDVGVVAAINRLRGGPRRESISNSHSQGRHGLVGESTSNRTHKNLVAAQTNRPVVSPKIGLANPDDFMAFINSSSGLSSSKFAPEQATSVDEAVPPHIQSHKTSQATLKNRSPFQQPPLSFPPAPNEGRQVSQPFLNNGPPVQKTAPKVNESVAVQSDDTQNSETLQSLDVKITKNNEIFMKGAVYIVKSSNKTDRRHLQVRVKGIMLVNEVLDEPEEFTVDGKSLTFRANLQAPTWHFEFPGLEDSRRFAAAFRASQCGRVQRLANENVPSKAVEVANQGEFSTAEEEELISFDRQEDSIQPSGDPYSATIEELASVWTEALLEKLDSVAPGGFISSIISTFGDTELILDTTFLDLATRTLSLGIGTSIYAPGNRSQPGIAVTKNASNVSPAVILYQELSKTKIWHMLPEEVKAALIKGTYKKLVQKANEIKSAAKLASKERSIYTSEELLQIRNSAPAVEKSSTQGQKALWDMINSTHAARANLPQQHIGTANDIVDTNTGQMKLEVVEPTASEVGPVDESTKFTPYVKHEVRHEAKLSCSSPIDSFDALDLSSKGNLDRKPGENISPPPSLLALDNKTYKGISGLATSRWAIDEPEVSTPKKQLKVEKRTQDLTPQFTRQETPNLSSKFALNASNKGSSSVNFVPQVTSPILPSPGLAPSAGAPLYRTVLVPGQEPNTFIEVTGILKVGSIPVVAHHPAAAMNTQENSRTPESSHRRNSSLKADAPVFSPTSQRGFENNPKMNVLLPKHPLFFPPHHHDPHHNLVSAHHTSPRMATRKRKADDDGLDDHMSISPQNSPAIASRNIARPSKKVRANEVTGRPLVLPRLLETLDAQSLRSVLQSICERHPDIGSEVVSSAPRPSVAATLEVLAQYQDKLREAFPFGGNAGSDYAYNRVKQSLVDLISALADFTPHYLPPNENQTSTSLSFLDSATKVVHDLPEWDSQSHKYHKDDAYDEMSKAWALVISEASKRGGGFQLHSGGWDQRLAKHNEQSGGRMQLALSALGSNLGWMGGNMGMGSGDPSSVRNQLISGTYGTNLPVRVGW